ncbi:Crp/Fnr family transcriptional regulator [Belliella marina]|uniref:Crp/Fnr family transcriptional regulator n=1 Tax=Belliella marina TaxID=1644146 RepID=A0ABW4VFZ2_9BACT
MDQLQLYFNEISPLSGQTWDEILPLFRQERIAKNEYFIKQNEVARKIGFLETGVVRAFFLNSQGKEYNKQFFVNQSIVGAYSSLLTGEPNLVAQQALTDCIVYTCDHADLVSRFDAYPDLERLARKIAEFYFIEKEKKEIEIVLLDAKQRYIIFKDEFPGLEQLVAQYHIASYLGISATQLSRIRHQFATKK